jgi:RimJ/RimL family protein N-acetyltransferase
MNMPSDNSADTSDNKDLVLKNNVLYMKKLTHKYTGVFHAMFNSKVMTRYMTIPYPLDRRWVSRYIKVAMDKFDKGDKYTWGVFRKLTNTFLGVAVIKNIDDENKVCEVGYAIGQKYWRRGFTSMAASLVIDYAIKELDINRIEIRVDCENENSCKFIENLGAVQEGVIRQALYHDGGYHDLIMFSILRDEYLARMGEAVIKEDEA